MRKRLQSDKTYCGEEELAVLRAENKRLRSLLEANGIDWQESLHDPAVHGDEMVDTKVALSPEEKVQLFRRLYRGRNDVFAVRWDSAKGKSGYSPACGNEWVPGVCQKPRIKCSECTHSQFLPLSDQVIYDHLAGRHTIGIYPLVPDDSCFFIAVDFDGGEWRRDAAAFRDTCDSLDIPGALEISRSGNGAHFWIFFSEAVAARDARQLGAALISRTCDHERQLSLSSYDRFFPNQDTLPKGGFGNLIALPLQKARRENGCSIFVDQNLEPYVDQWAYLQSVQLLSKSELQKATLRACDGRDPLDVDTYADECEKPWERARGHPHRLSGPMPESLDLVIANQIFVDNKHLPNALANRLIRLAAFPNPEFHKAQSMRLPVWNKPRIIGCAENHGRYIGLPRGCLEPVVQLLKCNHVKPLTHEKRSSGATICATFTGELRADQKEAVRHTLKHDVGTLCAPTAFGKTVVAASVIAQRKVSTLILVHRVDLLHQWKERLRLFLDLDDDPGAIGGGKKNPTGLVDIAVMQSLTRRKDLAEFLDGYGQIIVDECHHISAFSFEDILKVARSKFVLGLTATPVRRDGHHPIIFMQCGPLRHSAKRPETQPRELEVWPRYMDATVVPEDCPIHEVFRTLAMDNQRNRRIADDIVEAFAEGRKVLVLTQRTDHIEQLVDALGDRVSQCHVLHGRLSRKRRTAVMRELEELDGAAPRVLIATGRLVGEGFDHPPLDTLILALPISWRGTLQQYAGRLHRQHDGKDNVRICDYVDSGPPSLERMWDKRRRGYQAMGYQVRTGSMLPL